MLKMKAKIVAMSLVIETGRTVPRGKIAKTSGSSCTLPRALTTPCATRPCVCEEFFLIFPLLSRPSFVRAKSASEVELLRWSRGSWLNIEKEWTDKSIVARAEYVLVCCSTGQHLKEHCQEGQENLRGPHIRSALEQQSNDPGLTSAAQENFQPHMQKCRACDASGRCCCRGAVSVIIVLSEAPVQDR